MIEFRTLSGEQYAGYELIHDNQLSVPEVLDQLRRHLTGEDTAGRYIASCVSQTHPDDDRLFVTTIVLGG